MRNFEWTRAAIYRMTIEERFGLTLETYSSCGKKLGCYSSVFKGVERKLLCLKFSLEVGQQSYSKIAPGKLFQLRSLISSVSYDQPQKTQKDNAAPVVHRRSPIQVLTGPIVARLL
jgi:hypothetical protein